MTQDEEDELWESVFPTRCPSCNDLLVYYLFNHICPNCEAQFDAGNYPHPSPNFPEPTDDDQT